MPNPPGRAPSLADGDAADQILSATGGMGVDCGVEAVGYQAHDSSGQEHPEMVLDALSRCVRTTGGIGVVGVYVPQDPGAAARRRRTAGSRSTSGPCSRRNSTSAPASAR
jgi:threonine dehydrogenase-like Zn-dependent dehydrogenase